MTIRTDVFESEHGRKPRGHGLWMFLIQRRPGEFTDFQATGLYGDACKQAKAEAKLIGGASAIVVQP